MSVAVTEEVLLHLADQLRPHMEQAMKMEVAPWIRDYVVNMEDLYSDLTLERIVNTSAFQKPLELRHYMEIFCEKEIQNRRMILAKGEAHIGKSIFAKKIALDWAKKIFKAYCIVFFVYLKLVEPCDTIENVIIKQMPVFKGLNISAKKLQSIMESFGSQCLLILDGLDEHHLSQNDDILSIIRGEKHLDCSILVTSRPHSVHNIKRYFPTVIHVNGFTESEARRFAATIMRDERKVLEVLNFKPDPHKQNYLYRRPILLSFLCFLVRKDDIDLINLRIKEKYTQE